MKAVTLYITCSDETEARAIGKQLLTERLVACINILPAIQSLYWWNDEIQDDSETAFFAKTTEDKVDQIIKRIGELHSYDCPCVVALPIEKGNPAFLDWIVEQTKN
ncbi:Divalent-cation tolerance protein CutA [Candidatus Terasakiella magnetica]|uniref:Divalent-cation tolerance protein CutA n=1 Tax=Candidatus Terasakiella magnetica TaxID=1867952 RepID=A0A1C3RD39_9PROT|nr:divalent-cation tolerance protein CutA [Candidatus Terasakiella magnetica]SCA55162.1 Divalent-cation tolerance protein CutA [Candidatus Terasakiella magnetica]